VHGVIDVLYQNRAGDWHLLDWKTDYVTKNNLKDLEENYLRQISFYFHAASSILKISPIASLAFLNPNTRLINIVPSEIDDIAIEELKSI